MPRSLSTQMWRGTVPWNVDEFKEVLEWHTRLQHTPKDDWDLQARPAFRLIDKEAGTVQDMVFNPFIETNQFCAYMVDRYGDQMACHAYRFYLIRSFCRRYRSRLIRDGFAREGENGGPYEYRGELLQALCELRYTRVKLVNGEKQYNFSYRRVLGAAQSSLDQAEQDEQ